MSQAGGLGGLNPYGNLSQVQSRLAFLASPSGETPSPSAFGEDGYSAASDPQASLTMPSEYGADSYTPGSFQTAAMGEDGKIPIFQLGSNGKPVIGPNGRFLPSDEAIRRNG